MTEYVNDVDLLNSMVCNDTSIVRIFLNINICDLSHKGTVN